MFTPQSNAVVRNLHDCTQCAQIREQLPSEGSTQPLEDDCEILRPMCFTLSVTLQSSILFFTRAARHYISSFLLSAIQEMNPSNDHSTCTQMTLKHKTDRHADSNIDSPFAISCLPRDHHHPPTPLSLEMCSNSRSDCHISFYRSREKE